MSALKAAALARLEQGGAGPARLEALRNLALPEPRLEAWRWFPLRQLALKRFTASAEAGPTVAPPAEPLELRWHEGRLDRSGRQALLPLGITLGRAIAGLPLPHFAGLARVTAPERAHVRVVKDLPQPLWLRPLSGTGSLSAMDAVLQIGAGARATIVEDLRGAPREHAALSMLKVRVAHDAQLTWLRLVDDDVRNVRLAHTRFQLGPRAQLRWFGLDQQVGISRHELDVVVQGKKASVQLRGGALVDGREFTEHRLTLVHAAPGCDSDTLWKLVGRGNARAAFTGRIEIVAGADHTDAQLKTANLLLSEQAEIDCKPELEIHADEVRASHGATVGQLDERALFYLRSRGIGVQEARELLIGAFIRELFDDLPDGPLREIVAAALDRRLPALDLAA